MKSSTIGALHAHSLDAAILVPSQTKFEAGPIATAIGVVVDIAVANTAMQAKHVPFDRIADDIAAFEPAVEAKLLVVGYSLEDSGNGPWFRSIFPPRLGICIAFCSSHMFGT